MFQIRNWLLGATLILVGSNAHAGRPTHAGEELLIDESAIKTMPESIEGDVSGHTGGGMARPVEVPETQYKIEELLVIEEGYSPPAARELAGKISDIQAEVPRK